MPRIRTIKPSFFTSDDVSALPLRARLTWIGLWTHCDDQGRTKDHARLIKAAIWPLDPMSLADIEEDLSTLADHGRIVRYEVDGQRYLAIVNWHVHQSINRPTPSRIPAPPLNGHAPLSESSPTTHSGKGREGKGREGDARAREDGSSRPDQPSQEPPRICPEHINDPKPPRCGPCADARRAADRWRAERTARIAEAPRCLEHPWELAENCRLCRSEQLGAA